MYWFHNKQTYLFTTVFAVIFVLSTQNVSIVLLGILEPENFMLLPIFYIIITTLLMAVARLAPTRRSCSVRATQVNQRVVYYINIDQQD